jgi:transglutaminase-like putative cysteine protease
MPNPPVRTERLIPIRSGIFGTNDSLGIMAAVVRGYESDPIVRGQAKTIVEFLPARNAPIEVNALFEWVRDNIRYLSGPLDVEQVHTPDVTLEDRQGKCTDQAVLLATMLRSIGYPVKFIAAAYQMPGVFEHVYVGAKVRGEWVTLDTTIPYEPNCDMLPCPGTYGYEPPGARSRVERSI